MPVTLYESGGRTWSVTDHPNGYLVVNCVILTPEQAIAVTLGSEREKALESLARDMFAYIDNCCESDLSFGCVDPVDCAYYDKARDWCTKASSLKQRMKTLGLEVDKWPMKQPC
jgi:hypothetical protein